MKKTVLAAALAALVALPLVGHSKTLTWSSQGDFMTLDPHAQNENLTITGSMYVYEALVDYDKDFQIVPSLATAWEQREPTVWRFTLREGVKFHDGAAFSADDVDASGAEPFGTTGRGDFIGPDMRTVDLAFAKSARGILPLGSKVLPFASITPP